MNLINEITKLQAANKLRFESYIKRVCFDYAEANQPEPNVDCKYRLHAPCDNYIIPSALAMAADVSEDLVYAKGEFLPMPKTDEELGFVMFSANDYTYKTKIKVDAVHRDLLDEAVKLKMFAVSYGKTWEVGTQVLCYAYVETNTKGMRNIMDRFADYLYEEAAKILEAKKDDEKAKKGVAPEGKQLIKGVVVMTKISEGYYGYEHKMMVILENGATVYGSVPSKISDVEKGQTVEFSANFEHSDNDNTHSFYKRPTKAIIVS